MNRSIVSKTLVAFGVSTLLAGCSTIAGWFPDKQKQYKYSTEIPPLEIPPDLMASGVDGAGHHAGRRAGPEPGLEQPEPDVSAGEAATPESDGAGEEQAAAREPEGRPPRKPRGEPPASSSVLAQSAEDVPLIEIEEPFVQAWNDVARALGRMEVEVSDRNRSEGMYFVYYGGAKPTEEHSFLKDIASVFGVGEPPAQEFRVKLEERAQATMVTVLDKEGKPQTEGKGLELLKKLHETLQSLSRPREGDKEGDDEKD